MDLFIASVGVSYLPLHKEAIEVAKCFSKIYPEGSSEKSIMKAISQNRIGFKRRIVRV